MTVCRHSSSSTRMTALPCIGMTTTTAGRWFLPRSPSGMTSRPPVSMTLTGPSAYTRGFTTMTDNLFDGMNVFEVGGTIRDEILGLQNKDHDFSVECASFEEL